MTGLQGAGGPAQERAEGIHREELQRWSMMSDPPVGRLHHLGPVVRLSETPPRWALPSATLGYHEPVWPARPT